MGVVMVKWRAPTWSSGVVGRAPDENVWTERAADSDKPAVIIRTYDTRPTREFKTLSLSSSRECRLSLIPHFDGYRAVSDGWRGGGVTYHKSNER